MDDLRQLFARFEESPPSHLARADAERLAQLIQSDPRCCAGLPRSFASRRTRTRFRKVLTTAWLDEAYAEVLDYRPRLLRSAGQHKRRRAPLVALVLYAIWIEHTVNAIVISAARLRGHTGDVDALAQQIVAADFPTRLSRLWTRYHAPALDRVMKARVLKFMDLRNDMVHYKWIGLSPAALESELSHMRTLVAGARTLVTYLRKIERRVTTLWFRRQIRALLGLRSPRALAV
jgi:hypothetical protein